MKSDAAGMILQWIGSKNIKKGARLPSVRFLAEELNVGRMALNRAIAEMIGKGIVLRQGKRLFLGDVVIENEVLPPIDLFVEAWHDVTAVIKLARRWRLEVRSHRSLEPEDRRRQLLDLIQSGLPTSGVLIFGAECSEQLAELQKRHIPVVVFGDRSDHFSYVASAPQPVADLAIKHLVDLGHREIAYLALPSDWNFPLQHIEVEEAYVGTCKRLGLASSAHRLFRIQDDPASVRRLWQEIRRQHSSVTALICEIVQLASSVIRFAQADGINIPRDLSVISAYNQYGGVTRDFPITAIEVDEKQMIQMATLRLLEDIDSSHMMLGKPVQRTALCLPRLFERESTAAVHPDLASAPGHPQPSSDSIFPSDSTWPKDAEKRLAKVVKINARRFAGVNDMEELIYTPLDLSAHANRLLTKHYCWLGKLPLLHFPPGVHEIHGVPITVLNKALVLKSSFARSVNGIALPESVTLAVHRKLDGLFILHGGGWLKYHESIGTYDFHFADKRMDSVDVIAFGAAAQKSAGAQARKQASIIQDWHPSTPYFDSAIAKPYLVTQNGDPLRYLRILCLYHWANPYPDTTLQSITLKILNPESQATLGVIGITTYQRDNG